jgi:hypothetical protein
MIETPLLLLALLAADGKPAPKMPVGKDTTVVTGPLDREGYIDYQAALNDRLARGITPEKNANALLWNALGPTPEGGKGMPDEFFVRLGIARPGKEGAYLIGLQSYAKDHLKLDQVATTAFFDQQARAALRPWARKDFPQVASWLEANEKPLAVVIEATRRPAYFNPLTSFSKGPGSLLGSILSGVQKCRAAAAALSARAMLRVAEGKHDEAWQDLLACHRLGRHIGRGATMIEALVGIAIDQIASNADLAYLESAGLTAKQIQDRLKDLQALPPFPPLAVKIGLAERFTFLDCIQFVRRGGVGGLEGLAGGKMKKPDKDELRALEKIDWRPALVNGNRWYDRLVAALAEKDRAGRTKAFARIEADLKGLKEDVTGQETLMRLLLLSDPPDQTIGKVIGDVLVTLLMPAVHKVQDAHDRAEQIGRNTQIAFALAAYRRDRGRYPAKLDDLAPKYLARVPGDVFSGRGLIYRPEEKSYLLYSIGANGKDEGGRWYDDDPPGDDPRVRMPLPPVKKKK